METINLKKIKRKNQLAWCKKLMDVPPNDISKVIAMSIDQRIIYFKNLKDAK